MNKTPKPHAPALLPKRARSPLRENAHETLLTAFAGVDLDEAEARSLWWLADFSETAHRIARLVERARGVAYANAAMAPLCECDAQGREAHEHRAKCPTFARWSRAHEGDDPTACAGCGIAGRRSSKTEANRDRPPALDWYVREAWVCAGCYGATLRSAK